MSFVYQGPVLPRVPARKESSMTRIEFAQIMAYLEAGTGKGLSGASADVYWDLLNDLDAAVLQTAARRVLTEHRWATFPSIAELREAATETQRGEMAALSAAQAWELAWAAAGKIDLDIEGSLQRHTETLPPVVVEAMRAFGVPALVYGKEPVAVVRAQFLKVYDQLAAIEKRLALMPPGVQEAVQRIGREQKSKLPAPVVRQLQSIGKENP